MDGFWLEASNNMGELVKAGDHLFVTRGPVSTGDLALLINNGEPSVKLIDGEVPAGAYKIHKILKDQVCLGPEEMRQAQLDLED